MSVNKKIAWQSWNAVVEEIYEKNTEIEMLEELLLAQEIQESHGEMPIKFIDPAPRVIYTPYGMFPVDSFLKPSDRWNCWLGYTNFDITHTVQDILEETEGVEAIKVLGRYTFFIGVGKLFNPTDVRLNIENILTDTTHISSPEAVSNEISDAIESIKSQVSAKRYWSIFVSSVGEIDYIMSDALDEQYLHELNKFEDLRQKIGGIIIRSSNEQKY
jgi:hypothetical protein|tara:strand:+ start:1234 stop:1881 length:648 start_codon:yes stop_codon:yes gene_type:complete